MPPRLSPDLITSYSYSKGGVAGAATEGRPLVMSSHLQQGYGADNDLRHLHHLAARHQDEDVLDLDCPEEQQQQLPPPQQSQLSSFWQAIQQRREDSDQQAAIVDSQRFKQESRCNALVLGQVIAFIAASVNVTSFTLENTYHVVTPTFQLFVMYCFLSLHLCFRSTPPPDQPIYRMPLLGFRLRIPWYLYLFFSLVDVGAGIIMLLSLQYTSLTSVTLLGSLTVPSTMLFSKFLLDKSFHMHHFWGVCLCLIGGCLTIWSDLDRHHHHQSDTNGDTTSTEHSSVLMTNIGDFMAIFAALLYGLGDAVSEYSVKHIDRMEFFGMMGFFGIFLTGIQFPFQEGDTLAALLRDPWSVHSSIAFVLMATYVALLLLYYVTEGYFLVSSDATLLNLSLQVQNLWSIVFSILVHQAAPPGLFYLAVVLVFAGVAAYEVGPSSDPVLQLVANQDSQRIQQQRRLDEEGGGGGFDGGQELEEATITTSATVISNNSSSTSELESNARRINKKKRGVQYSSIRQIDLEII